MAFIFKRGFGKRFLNNSKWSSPSSTVLTLSNRNTHSHDSKWGQNGSEKVKFAALAGVALSTGLAVKFYLNESGVSASETQRTAGRPRRDLPKYKMSEVRKHCTQQDVWVTYGEGVYDITPFVDQHPGGEAILMAAGSALEPFWSLYGVHLEPHIQEILEKYRIGNLDPGEARENSEDASDPYHNDPVRHPVLKPSSSKPFNAEPPPELLVGNFLTPQELFYVRNHLPVPEVDEESYRLEIEGLGLKSKSLKLSDIKRLPKVTITAAIMCAGNRRSEMTEVKPVKGLSWGHAAIGNATWTGARLSDILKEMGVTDSSKAEHVQFEGMDTDAANNPYGASIPIEKALDPKGDVILAYEMNGEPLNRDHGYPVRVVVPGIVGARNVKWLNRIVLSQEESHSHWQRNDYKGFSPSTDWDTVDFTKSPAIQELPVISAICSPSNGQKIKIDSDGTVLVKGYAWSGGGRRIVRVDLTSDEGSSWVTAELTNQDASKSPRHWGWTLWTAKVPVNPKSKTVELWAKAVDSSYNTQPESFRNIWNLRGVLSNAYHRVKIETE